MNNFTLVGSPINADPSAASNTISGSFTLVAGQRYVVVVFGAGSSATPANANPTFSNDSLDTMYKPPVSTFSELHADGFHAHDQSGGAQRVTAAFAVFDAANSGSETISAVFPSSTITNATLVLLTSASGFHPTLTSSVLQIRTADIGGTGTGVSVTLTTPASNSIGLGLMNRSNAVRTPVVGSGYTSLHNAQVNSNNSIGLVEYINPSQATIDVTWASGADEAGLIGIEFASAPTVPIELEAAAACSVSATGALTTGINMVSAVSLAVAISASLVTSPLLNAAVTASVSSTGGLTTGIPISAGVTCSVTASGVTGRSILLVPLGMGVQFEGVVLTIAPPPISMAVEMQAIVVASPVLLSSVSCSISAVGNLTSSAILLVGSADVAVTVKGELFGSTNLAAVASCSVTASGELVSSIELAGPATVSVSCAGVLTTGITLVGSPVLSVTCTGDLTTGIVLTSSVNLAVSAEGTLTTQILLSSSVSASITATGTLQDRPPSTASNLEGRLWIGPRLRGTLSIFS